MISYIRNNFWIRLLIPLSVLIIFIACGYGIGAAIHQHIDKGITNLLTIDPDQWSIKDYENWRNFTTQLEYTIMSISNLKEVMESDETVKPKLIQMGPYKYNRSYILYNISFFDDSYGQPKTRYLQWIKFRIDPDTKNSLTDEVIVPNGAYMAMVGVAGGETKLWQRMSAQNLIFSAFSDIFMESDTSPLIYAIKIFSIQYYFNIVISRLKEAHGITRKDAINHWAAGSQVTPYSDQFLDEFFDGFELGNNITIEQSNLLWDNTSLISFFSPIGIIQWISAVQNTSSTEYNSISEILSTNGPPESMSIVVQWVEQSLISATFLNNVLQALVSLNWITPLEQSQIQKWGDLGCLQWGSSRLTSKMVHLDSIYDLNVDPTLTAPPEISAYAKLYMNKTINLDIIQTKSFLNTFSNQKSANEFIELVKQGDKEKAVNLYGHTGVTLKNIDLYLDFISCYSPREHLLKREIIGYPLNDDGTGKFNGGAFVRVTPHQVLYGYKDFLLYQATNLTYPGITGPWLNSIDESYQYFKDTFSDPDDCYWTKYTGKGKSLSKYANWLSDFQGYQLITNVTDIHQPCPTYTTDCRAWLSPESVDKTSDTRYGPPSYDNSNTKLSSFPVWINDVLRVVTFSFNDTIEEKGISLNRFIVDPNNFAIHAKYRMNENGLFPMGAVMRGLPLAISIPLLGQYVDQKWRNYIDGIPQEPVPDVSYVAVEPHTGIIMMADKRLGGNIHFSSTQFDGGMWDGILPKTSEETVGKISGPNIPGDDIYIPFFTAREYGVISESDAHRVKTTLLFFINLESKLRIGLIISGFVLAALIFYLLRQKEIPENEPQEPLLKYIPETTNEPQ